MPPHLGLHPLSCPPIVLPACALARSCPGTWGGEASAQRAHLALRFLPAVSGFLQPFCISWRKKAPLVDSWPGLPGSQNSEPLLQPSPGGPRAEREDDGVSEKSHPYYLGSKGQNLCSDREGQENGEFQCGLSLAADFAAESGSVTVPGRMPQEAWAAFAGLTTAPAQSRHGRVQALGLTLTRVFLSLTLIRSRSSHAGASLYPPFSSLLTLQPWPSWPFVNETPQCFWALFDPSFNEHSPPRWRLGQQSPLHPPRGGALLEEVGQRQFCVFLSPGGSQTLPGTPRHFGSGQCVPSG